MPKGRLHAFSGKCSWSDTPSTARTVVSDVESVAPEMNNSAVIVAEEFPTSSHAPYMTNAVSVRERENFSTIVRSPKKRLLNTAIEPTTAAVKAGIEWDVIEASESAHLSPETVVA